jgi:uncharacterized protein YbjT (DUF2867 family)
MKILFIGATGFLGKPVAKALTDVGHQMTLLVRNVEKAKSDFPTANIIQGDLNDSEILRNALTGQDAVYLSLSVKQDEKENDFHAESEGLDNVLKISKMLNIKRIAYLASIVQNYQGINGFDWWVFRLKHEATQKIKNSGIAYTIFYAAAFMDTLINQGFTGSSIDLMGKSVAPMWYISIADYARQAVKSFEVLTTENREYFMQGLEAFTQKEMAEVFAQHYSKQKLSVKTSPIFILKIIGIFNQKANYGYHILMALNNNPETFRAEQTWRELGKPTVKLKDYASTL